MNAWCWNGSAYEVCTSLPVTDRGFRYGMALFETIRLYLGRPLFLAEHLAQLRTACLDRAFPLAEPALAALPPLLAGQPDGTARLYITAGDSAQFTDPVSEPRIFVLCEARPDPNSAPCAVTLSSALYHAPFGGLKTANYWGNLDALQQAQRSGYDEALLFNENSELVSATTANLFLVHDGLVSTPSTACGARAGVVRAWVMKQKQVHECSLFLQDLQEADELFLTSSWYGIRPVASRPGSLLSSSKFTAELLKAYTRTFSR